jgi:hypothetical protein
MNEQKLLKLQDLLVHMMKNQRISRPMEEVKVIFLPYFNYSVYKSTILFEKT